MSDKFQWIDFEDSKPTPNEWVMIVRFEYPRSYWVGEYFPGMEIGRESHGDVMTHWVPLDIPPWPEEEK